MTVMMVTALLFRWNHFLIARHIQTIRNSHLLNSFTRRHSLDVIHRALRLLRSIQLNELLDLIIHDILKLIRCWFCCWNWTHIVREVVRMSRRARTHDDMVLRRILFWRSWNLKNEFGVSILILLHKWRNPFVSVKSQQSAWLVSMVSIDEREKEIQDLWKRKIC